MEVKKQSILDTVKEYDSLSTLIPITIGATYFTGFVVINSYLSKFGFLDNNLLSTNYLIAGFSFLIVIIPLFFYIQSNYNNPTDNLNKNWQESLVIIAIILRYAWIFDLITYTNFTNNVTEHFWFRISQVMIIASFMIANFFLEGKKPWLVHTINLAPISLYSVISLFYFPIIVPLKIIIISFGFFYLIALGEYGDGNFRLGRNATLIFAYVGLASIFGHFVFDKFPTYLGGRNNTEIQFFVADNNKAIFIQSGISLDSNLSFHGTLLYKTDSQLLIEVDSSYKTISIDLINLMTISTSRERKPKSANLNQILIKQEDSSLSVKCDSF